MRSILFLTQDEPLARELRPLLDERDLDLVVRASVDETLAAVSDTCVTLILVDDAGDGVDVDDVFVGARSQRGPGVLVVVLTTETRESGFDRLLRQGLTDVLRRPISARLLAHKLRRLIETHVDADTGPFIREHTLTRRLELTQTHRGIPDGRCADCHLALQQTRAICPDCLAPRPTPAWPDLGAGPFPLLGTAVDRFALEKGLATDGVVDDYLATDRSLGQLVMVKVIAYSSYQSGIGALRREQVKAAARCASPHVLHVWEVVQLDGGQLAIVMDYVDGAALEEILHVGQPLPLRSAIEVVRQLADAVAAVHAEGIYGVELHRRTVRLQWHTGDRPFVQLAVLGFAPPTQAPKARASALGYDARHYAPEERPGLPVLGPAVDVYRLGALGIHLITGAPPDHPDPSVASAWHLDALDAEPHVRAGITQVFGRALAHRPDARYASMTELAVALTRLSALLRYQPQAGLASDEIDASIVGLLQQYVSDP